MVIGLLLPVAAAVFTLFRHAGLGIDG